MFSEFRCRGVVNKSKLTSAGGGKILLTVNTRHQISTDRLHLLSERLEELFAQVSAWGGQPPPQELADELAATAGEVMVELADLGDGEHVRGAMEDARRLRAAARTLGPDAERLAEGGAALARDVEMVIRSDRRAA